MAVMYIGPTKISEGLKRNTIYWEVPAEKIQTLKEKYPLVEHLFVDVSKLSAATESLKWQGTPIYKAAKQIRA